MNKRQTRAFFLGSTVLFSLIFLALTIDTPPADPDADPCRPITPEVIAGKHVWHRKNCINCHTLLGEGAYYAPDLTKITEQRGAPYLQPFLADPAEVLHRRAGPAAHAEPEAHGQEIDEVIAFLTWVGKINTQGWPPRPILVSGSAIPGSDVGGAAPQAASDDPIAVGQALFQPVAARVALPVTRPAAGVNLVGPSLAGIAATAPHASGPPDYHGKATDAAGYIRESILDPERRAGSRDRPISSNGQSLMPPGFDQSLQPAQVDALVAYLMTLK